MTAPHMPCTQPNHSSPASNPRIRLGGRGTLAGAMAKRDNPCARRPSRWTWSSAVIALVLVTAGCGTPRTTPSGSLPPTGQAVVTGGIIPCAGVAIQGGPRYSAGLVDVLRGEVAWKPMADGNSQAVFPEAVVAEQRVTTNGSYRFLLPAGRYVLQAHFAPPANIVPFREIAVETATTMRADIPNMCM
jgi:hypothetical protein